MKVAVVILNWNGKALLEQFLPSVIQHSERADIYVADNASTDDSVAFVKTNYPDIHIIQNAENGGYAKGYNDALKHVEADIFCLLNSDVEVTSGWLSPIITQFEADADTGIIQPKILDHKDKSKFEYAGASGGYLDKYGYPYCRGRIFDTLEEDQGQYDDITDIFWASGACFFVRSKVFFELNGFDEDFFAHQEEIDLCWRARSIGYGIKVVPSSVVYHVGGATLQEQNPKKTYLNFRNSLFLLLKNLKGKDLVPVIFSRMLLDGLAAIRFLTQGKGSHFFAVFKAHLHFYARLNHFRRKRILPKNSLKHYQITSIVWGYFVNRKKTYKEHTIEY